jgi:hypothetical protein
VEEATPSVHATGLTSCGIFRLVCRNCSALPQSIFLLIHLVFVYESYVCLPEWFEYEARINPMTLRGAVVCLYKSSRDKDWLLLLGD